jgi:hypothetical protein
MANPDLLHRYPAPHLKTYEVFLIYFPKCQSFSTMTLCFVKFVTSIEVRINEFPLFSFAFLRIVISWCSLFISKLTVMLFRDGINQILVGISSSPMAILVQFNGRLLISVVGSKMESKFLIVISLFY